MESWNLLSLLPDSARALDRERDGSVELLARLLSGPRPRARERAKALLAEHDLSALAGDRAHELDRLTAADRDRIAAGLELARRIQATRAAKRPTLRTPRRVFDLLHARLADLEQETFLALHLDGKHRLRALRLVSIGTLTTSLVHPREVFRDAVRSSAAALIVVHNHPSGDPEPSGEDLAVTRRLQASGDLLGIPLLDHVILAANSFLSLRTRMDFDAKPRPSEVRGASTCRSCG